MTRAARLNPALVALWTALVVGVGGLVFAGMQLEATLPDALDQETYGRIDWAWLTTLELVVLPGVATLAVAGGLALLAYYAVVVPGGGGTAARDSAAGSPDEQ